MSAATCLQADIAAKAAFLLGEDGPEWLDERALPGRFLLGGRHRGRERVLAARSVPQVGRGVTSPRSQSTGTRPAPRASSRTSSSLRRSRSVCSWPAGRARPLAEIRGRGRPPLRRAARRHLHRAARLLAGDRLAIAPDRGHDRDPVHVELPALVDGPGHRRGGAPPGPRHHEPLSEAPALLALAAAPLPELRGLGSGHSARARSRHGLRLDRVPDPLRNDLGRNRNTRAETVRTHSTAYASRCSRYADSRVSGNEITKNTSMTNPKIMNGAYEGAVGPVRARGDVLELSLCQPGGTR